MKGLESVSYGLRIDQLRVCKKKSLGWVLNCELNEIIFQTWRKSDADINACRHNEPQRSQCLQGQLYISDSMLCTESKVRANAHSMLFCFCMYMPTVRA